ncbi:MAG: hypothetical protein QM737_04505 [Ferruginibacter sp.]
MRKLVLLLLELLIFLNCFAQKTTRIDNYVLPSLPKEEKLIIIEMSFGDASVTKITGDTSELQNAGNIFVDVVCTDYRSGQSLKSLNQKRLDTFLKRFPFVKRGSLSKINFFRQMDGAEKEKAQTMFHGLVIRYRPRQSAAAMKQDIDILDEMITTIEKDPGAVMVEHTLSKADRDSILQMVKLKRGQPRKRSGPAQYEPKPYDVSATGYDRVHRSTYDSTVTMPTKTAYKKGLLSKAVYKSYDWTPYVTFYYHEIGDTMVPVRRPVLTKEVTVTDTLKPARQKFPPPDSTLLKIFARTNWKHFTVVGDVTVSMYPYSAQLLLWLKLHTVDSVTNSFVFFNDGNEKPDDEKIIGNTGGVYFKDCNSFEQVKKLMRETMLKGSGGDRPENNIEALLVGEREFPGNDFQVLIADNMADIKDKSLTKKLTKPVRIILCGANAYNINLDYLNLAKQTNGSVHLVEKDIYDLANLHDGEILKIGNKDYKIEKGAFIETGTIEK